MSLAAKLILNLKNGTVFKNGYAFVKRRVIKFIKFNNLFYFLDLNRHISKKISNSISPLAKNHYKIGNYYYSDSHKFNEESIVYSLGVGKNIEFDLAFAKKFNSKIYMFDPTPASIEFMKNVKNDNFIFDPIGIWDSEKTLNFYVPSIGGCSSILMDEVGKFNFSAQCLSLDSIMSKYKHNHIDFLKVDIEGAGIVMMKDLYKKKIFPSQIAIELENPYTNKLKNQLSHFNDVMQIIDKFGEHYNIFNIPSKGYKYLSIELLMVKKND